MLEEVVHFSKDVKVWTILIAALAIVSFWRGVWGLMDLYLFPENLALSFGVSIIFGLVILWMIRKRRK